MAVARVLQAAGGLCQLRELAEAMEEHQDSGNFRQRMAAARLFGIVDLKQGRYRLTELGGRLTDERGAVQARLDAFLHVPLFRRIYNDHGEGRPLPPRTEPLEDLLVSLGVPPKQKTRARQTFERSAQYAGILKIGDDRFGNLPTAAAAAPLQPTQLQRDPLIVALLEKLPPPGEPWPVASRVRWLRTLTTALAQLYDQDGEKGDIEIRVMPARKQ
jgi:hypothetical protein